MIDYMVIITSSFSFLIFVISLTLLVRAKGQAEILVSMKKLFLVLLCVSSIIFWVILGNMNGVDKMVLLCVHLVLFWAMSFSYILGLFGIPLTSLRIQFLLTLFAHGASGSDLKTLMKEYSKKSIVRIRLHRLETSGEIIRKGKYYMLRSRWSYFVLHNYFLLLLLNMYRPIQRR